MEAERYADAKGRCVGYVTVPFQFEQILTGVVISPWNYPLILSLQGTIGAIAAGCTLCLKLSEVTSNYAGLLQRLFPKYLDQDAVRIVCGGVPEITKVLELKWDHSEYRIVVRKPFWSREDLIQ